MRRLSRQLMVNDYFVRELAYVVATSALHSHTTSSYHLRISKTVFNQIDQQRLASHNFSRLHQTRCSCVRVRAPSAASTHSSHLSFNREKMADGIDRRLAVRLGEVKGLAVAFTPPVSLGEWTNQFPRSQGSLSLRETKYRDEQSERRAKCRSHARPLGRDSYPFAWDLESLHEIQRLGIAICAKSTRWDWRPIRNSRARSPALGLSASSRWFRSSGTPLSGGDSVYTLCIGHTVLHSSSHQPRKYEETWHAASKMEAAKPCGTTWTVLSRILQ